MLNLFFRAIFAFLKYTAIALYMLTIFLFIIYGAAFVEAYALR